MVFWFVKFFTKILIKNKTHNAEKAAKHLDWVWVYKKRRADENFSAMNALDLAQHITDKQESVFNEARSAVHLNAVKFRKERLAHARCKTLPNLKVVWKMLRRKFRSQVEFDARLP